MELFFVGDLYYNPNKSNKKIEFSEDLLELIQCTDLFCANLEGVMTRESKTKSNVDKKGPCIKQDAERIKKFIEEITKESNVSILLTEANNHIMDYNYESLQYTNQEIRNYKRNVNLIGAGTYKEAYEPFIFEKEGKSVGVISVAEAGFGVVKLEADEYGYAWFLHENVFDNITKIKEKCDYTVVVSHAGLEEVDIPLPEIRKLYRSFVEAGADLIIGHHPHAIQGKESYKNGLIYYSLGNFMFDEDDGDGEYNGHSIGVKITIGEENVIKEVPLLYCDGRVGYDMISQQIFDNACLKLQEERYDYLINDICEKFYVDVYKGYYCNVHGLENPIYNLLKVLKSLIINKELFDENWLYHNLEIETHRWTVMRGLEEHKRKRGIRK